MSHSEFRFRGIPVVLDTTAPAEFDIQDCRLTDKMMERLGRELKEVTFSSLDRVEGYIRIRRWNGHDVIYIVGRADDKIVITIGGIIFVGDGDSEVSALKLLEKK